MVGERVGTDEVLLVGVEVRQATVPETLEVGEDVDTDGDIEGVSDGDVEGIGVAVVRLSCSEQTPHPPHCPVAITC